jgi:hypothetical protein
MTSRIDPSERTVNSILRTPFASLEVVRLGRTEWRISDTSEPERLLGYIERQRPRRFEVLWMTDPMRWGYAESFGEALVAFGDSARFTGETFLERAVPVARRNAGGRRGILST